MLLSSNCSSVYFSYGAYPKAHPSPDGPTTINDYRLPVEKVTSDLTFPTSMTFVGNNDVLVTEKNTGMFMRILDGQIQDNPLLVPSVASEIERELLGITTSKHLDGKIFVFLSYTESGNNEDGSDVSNKIDPLVNGIYRYQYVDYKLIDPILLLD